MGPRWYDVTGTRELKEWVKTGFELRAHTHHHPLKCILCVYIYTKTVLKTFSRFSYVFGRFQSLELGLSVTSTVLS